MVGLLQVDDSRFRWKNPVPSLALGRPLCGNLSSLDRPTGGEFGSALAFHL